MKKLYIFKATAKIYYSLYDFSNMVFLNSERCDGIVMDYL